VASSQRGGVRFRGVPVDPAQGPPVVSVVVPTFNPGPDLEPTLDSVLCQTFPDFEILVIDGGSTDGTVETLRRFGDRIECWISEPDRGVYDAYNKGIGLSRGEWIYFLPAGDRLTSPDLLRRIFAVPPSGLMVYGNVRISGTGTIYDGRFTRHKMCRRNICQQAIFYHRDLFRRLGPFDLRYPVLADRVFNYRCFGSSWVRPEYRDLVIAEYKSGGLSERVEDLAYVADRYRIMRESLGLGFLVLHRLYEIQKDAVNLFAEPVADWWRRKSGKPPRRAGRSKQGGGAAGKEGS
jgi:glycosyltransferase involved in cell wall biosynthesis